MQSDATLPCQLLSWDSEFFGFGVARVNADVLNETSVAQIDVWCRSHGVRCLYFLARSDDPSTTLLAESHGYHLTDVRVTLERKLTAEDRALPCGAIREARPEDLPALRALAGQSHTDSRFFHDPHISREKSRGLYEAWIENSCRGYAQRVLVTEDAAGPTAYISCHADAASGRGSIGLIGVDPRAQGRGLGTALVNGAIQWFASQSLNRVSVVTQGRNIPAQRLYQRCGFASASLQLYYHKWFAASEQP